MKKRSLRKLGFILMGIGLMLIVFGIYGLLRTVEYKAQATIKSVEPNTTSPHDPNFIQTELKLIQSDNILSNVLFQLDPNPRLGSKLITAKSLDQLRRRLDVRWRRSTTLIDIGVISQDADEAAKIANHIAELYCRSRRALWDKVEDPIISALSKELQLTDQKIKEAQAELERLKGELKIPSPEPSAAELETNYPTYQKAKQELDDLNTARKLLIRKINIETIDLTLPKPASVEIIELARTPAAPMRQTRLLGALLIVAGVICFGWGLKQVLGSNHSDNER